MRTTLATIAIAGLTQAASGQIAINWFTVDSGGGDSAGVLGAGTITIRGTIGQHDAGLVGGPGVAVRGGFWGNGVVPSLCIADVDDGSGTGFPDGGVTIEDLLYYLVVFGNGGVEADVDDGSATGTPDGGVTIEDLLYYLVRFENGC